MPHQSRKFQFILYLDIAIIAIGIFILAHIYKAERLGMYNHTGKNVIPPGSNVSIRGNVAVPYDSTPQRRLDFEHGFDRLQRQSNKFKNLII